MACELQRDWDRKATAEGFAEIILRSVRHELKSPRLEWLKGEGGPRHPR